MIEGEAVLMLLPPFVLAMLFPAVPLQPLFCFVDGCVGNAIL